MKFCKLNHHFIFNIQNGSHFLSHFRLALLYKGARNFPSILLNVSIWKQSIQFVDICSIEMKHFRAGVCSLLRALSFLYTRAITALQLSPKPVSHSFPLPAALNINCEFGSFTRSKMPELVSILENGCVGFNAGRWQEIRNARAHGDNKNKQEKSQIMPKKCTRM